VKIKTRLTLSVAIFALALLIIIGSVIVTNQQVDRLNSQEELAKTIEIEANELSYLSSDYILYHESQQAERWESKYSALASDLSDLAVDTPEQKVLVTNLMENQRRLKQVFDDVKSSITGSLQDDPAIDFALVQVSWSRFAVQTQGIVFDAGRLSHLLRDEADQVKQVSNLLIFLLMGTVSLFILTSYLIVFRRTLTSIAELHDGVKVIGSGDLNHAIPEKGDDEIRDLSRAFNQMTVDLKGVTASKAELEQEVSNRKKAEEEVGERNEELIAINEDLIKAGEMVRKSEERYRNLFNSMTEGFALHEIICDADNVPVDFRFLEINPAFEKLTALARDKVVGRLVSEVLPGIEPEWIETYGKVALTGTPVRFDNNSVPLKRHFEVYAFSPAPRQFAVLFSDITDRKQAEEELRQSYERTSTILESISDSFIAVDKHWRITYINRRAFGYNNRPPGEVLGKIIWEVFPAIVGTPLETFYREAMASQEPLTFTNTSIVATGKQFELHAYPMEDGLSIYGQDITDRKKAEEALRESETILRSFFDSSGVMRGIVEVIAEDDVLHITDNSTTAAFIGLSLEAMKNKTGSELGEPPDILRMWVSHYTESQKTGKPVVFEYRDMRGGKETWLHTSVSYLGTPLGGYPRFAYAVLDISERRKAEEKIARLLSEVSKEKDRLSALINSISDEIWFADTNKRFTLANPSAFLEFRLHHGDDIDVENLAGNLEVLRPDGNPRPVEEAPPLRALYGEIVRNQEEIIRTPGHGELRYRQVSSTPVRDDNGVIIGSVSVVRDITELKRTEEKLRDTSRYLENLLDYANAPIIVWDPDFKITRFNHAFERLTGRKASEVIGQRIDILFPEKDAGTAMDIIMRTTRGERLDVVEIPILHVSGTVRTVLWNSATLFEADGKTVLSTIAQGGDITERKRAEEELLRRNEDLNAAYEEITSTQEELQQSNDELIRSEQELRKTSQYLENLIDYANAPIVVWDPHFVITRFNRAFEELTGRTAREIIGQRLEVLFPQQYLDASMEIIRKTMKGERLKVVEIPILNRNGETRIVLWNSATLFEADGTTVQSTIAQGNDITERKITEAELEERNEELNSAIEELTHRGQELNEALKEKEVLLSEVHHRVKNNLTAFISLLSLESAYDDSPAGLALKKDLQNRARSMALIHETLYRTKTYSRVDMDVYLSTLVGQVVQSYESAKSIKMFVDAYGITLDLSRATPGGLIINELLTNSLKYAFPPSFDCEKIRGAPCMITVSLTEDDGAYILTVRDNGIGLPGDLDIATTKTLGLKLVNFLAKHQLKASIEVHPEEGAEFRFRFRDKV
jgi:PAS domain S-box-containing protein